MKYNVVLISLLFILTLVINGCKSGCVKCTGITADQTVCKDDYSENRDYEDYIRAYEEAGGVCEE